MVHWRYIRRRMRLRLRRGLTLVELLVLMVIISIAAALVMGSLNRSRAQERNEQRKNDITSISKALEAYRKDHTYLPLVTASGDMCDEMGAYCREKLDANSPVTRELKSGGYLAGAPQPPAGGSTDYYYVSEWGGTTRDSHTHYAIEAHFEPAQLNPSYIAVGADIGKLAACLDGDSRDPFYCVGS